MLHTPVCRCECTAPSTTTPKQKTRKTKLPNFGAKAGLYFVETQTELWGLRAPPRWMVFSTFNIYLILLNNGSGPEIGLPGWISAGF